MSRRVLWLVASLFVASAVLLVVFLLRPVARLATIDGYGRLVSYPGKVATPCPAQDQRTAVIFVAGQSNVANYAERHQTTAYKDRVFAFFDGACTIAGSPLLGADSHEGESLTPMADELIRSGRYDRVVLAPVAVGGTQIARWVDGDLAPVLRQALDAVQARYKVTHAIWHQGEDDALKGVSAADYRRSFDELLARWRAQGMTAPVFLSVTTRCYPGWTADNPVAQAQRSLPDPARGLYPGPDTDALLSATDLRGGACHHSVRGQARVAKLLAAALLAVNRAP
jgi:hypothetical protein